MISRSDAVGRVKQAFLAGAMLLPVALLVPLGAVAQDEVAPLNWVRGPGTAPIGDALAEIDLGEGYVYLDAEGSRRLMELTHNPVSGQEMATIAPVAEGEEWWVIFEFEESGYVSDDERDDLDADVMLESIRAGTEASNAERERRGWATMSIVGWHEPPHYDFETNNLSWAVIGKSGEHENVNRIIKLLGRRGVMTATLVASPNELDSAIYQVDSLLAGYRFQPGNTYAEYVPGTDKLAAYGLTALVVGGGAAALAKSGLLARLWKPIAIGLAALGAGIKRFFGGGRSADHDVDKPIG
jgi:uncharacterized membrane-anchored protein